MAVETVRVTVVGTSKRVDVTVPARAAVVEFVDVLAEMCGEQTPDTQPAARSPGAADRRALPRPRPCARPGSSTARCCICAT